MAANNCKIQLKKLSKLYSLYPVNGGKRQFPAIRTVELEHRGLKLREDLRDCARWIDVIPNLDIVRTRRKQS